MRTILFSLLFVSVVLSGLPKAGAAGGKGMEPLNPCNPIKVGDFYGRSVPVKKMPTQGNPVIWSYFLIWPESWGLLAVDNRRLMTTEIDFKGTNVSTALIEAKDNLCLGTYDGRLRCFDKKLAAGLDVQVAKHIYALGAFKGGGFIASVKSPDDKAELWQLTADGLKVKVLAADQALNGDTIVPVGSKLLVATNQTAYLVDSKKGILSKKELAAPESFKKVYSFSNDRAFLSDAKGNIYSFNENGFSKTIPVFTKEILRVQHLDKGKSDLLAVKTFEGFLVMLDFKKGAEVNRFDLKKPNSRSMCGHARFAGRVPW